jgi:hypothetical protein
MPAGSLSHGGLPPWAAPETVAIPDSPLSRRDGPHSSHARPRPSPDHSSRKARIARIDHHPRRRIEWRPKKRPGIQSGVSWCKTEGSGPPMPPILEPGRKFRLPEQWRALRRQRHSRSWRRQRGVAAGLRPDFRARLAPLVAVCRLHAIRPRRWFLFEFRWLPTYFQTARLYVRTT